MTDTQDYGKVAIIADKYLAYGFRLAGVVAFPVSGVKDAIETLDRLIAEDEYDVVIMPEALSTALKGQRKMILAKERPIIAVIPDFNGPTGDRLRELHSLISQSVGAELKFD